MKTDEMYRHVDEYGASRERAGFIRGVQTCTRILTHKSDRIVGTKINDDVLLDAIREIREITGVQ